MQCFRQLIENLIHDNHSDPAIESDTGQYWQFLQCLMVANSTQIEEEKKLFIMVWQGWFCNVHANSGEGSELEYNFGKIARFSQS